MSKQSNLLLTTALTVALASLALAGCDDPSKGKAVATTSEAVAATTVQSAVADPKNTTRYAFDQGTSNVSWVGSKVTGKHDGGFGTFKGSIAVVDGAPEKSTVDVDIDTESLTTDVAKLTGHLKSPDFFDTKAHPKASFVSTSIKKGGDKDATHTITGNLTIKGITKSVTFPAKVSLGADTANVDAEFVINRRDFSLNYAGVPNDLIRDDVVIKLTIHAKRG